MELNSKIYVAGHNGLLGSAIVRALRAAEFANIIICRRSLLDLTDHGQVERFFGQELPEYIFLCAAKVGNIYANINYPAQYLYDNAQIELNVMHCAWQYQVSKVLFFGSNCFYPIDCHQPIREEYYMTGLPEPTNSAYAAAKVLGLEMCRAYNRQYRTTTYICGVPASTYGVNDHFNLERSHALTSLIVKLHQAKVSNLPNVVLWGDGSPKRELIYVDDVADAAIFMMNNFSPTEDQVACGDIFMNIGSGEDFSILALAEIIACIVGYAGNIVWDKSMPNGVPRKLLDSSKINGLGWRHKVMLIDGIERTYRWYLSNIKSDC